MNREIELMHCPVHGGAFPEGSTCLPCAVEGYDPDIDGPAGRSHEQGDDVVSE